MPTTTEAVKAEAREKKIREGKRDLLKHIPEAVEVLHDLLQSSDDRVRLQAASAILDRTLGRPRNDVDEGAPKALEEAAAEFIGAFAEHIKTRGALPAMEMEQPEHMKQIDGVWTIDGEPSNTGDAISDLEGSGEESGG